MVDGPTTATDLDQTESNREIVRSFVDNVLVQGQLEKLEQYIHNDHFTQHSPQIADGLSALRTALQTTSDNGITIKYNRLHRLLAEGCFVLSVSEGTLNDVHTSFYDLFRIFEGKLVEHWDTIETVSPRTEWKNENGKF